MYDVIHSAIFDHITMAYDVLEFTTVNWPDEPNANYVTLTLSQHGQDITPDKFEPYKLTPSALPVLLKAYATSTNTVLPSQRAWATALRTVPDFHHYCAHIDDTDSLNAFRYWVITHFATPIV